MCDKLDTCRPNRVLKRVKGQFRSRCESMTYARRMAISIKLHEATLYTYKHVGITTLERKEKKKKRNQFHFQVVTDTWLLLHESGGINNSNALSSPTYNSNEKFHFED